MADRRLLCGLLVCAAATLVAAPAAVRLTLRAEDETSAATAALPIQIFADWSQEWSDDAGYVGLFRGNCRIVQGDAQYTADKMVVWVSHETDAVEDSLTVYLEDNALSRTADGDTSANALVIALKTSQGMTLTVRGRQANTSGATDALYQRAMRRRHGARRQELQPTQLTIDPLVGEYRTVQLPGVSGGVRRVRIFQRGAIPFSIESFQNPDTSPPEQVVLLRGGINLLVEGATKLGTVDLSADRAVIWTTAIGSGEFSTDMLQTEDTPYQVYLEGNIVIRQGTTEVRADRAFYDAREDRALVLNAELKAYLPDLDSTVRVRSERLRQLSQVSFHAQNAWITTSQYGRPGYRIEASDVFLEQRPWSLWTAPRIDPQTGQPEPVYWATIFNGTLVVEDVPLLYAPRLSVPAEDPGIPLQSLTFRQDRIFGTQIRSRWDAFKLFGLERPPGDQWSLDVNLLSERGPFFGTDGHYRGMDGYGNTFFGNGVASYVHDDGNDNLGLGRRNLIPADNDRGRFVWRHRHLFNDDLMLQGEIGYESDRNYIEQYYEPEFDRGKDRETLAYLRQAQENWAWSVLVRPQVNMFENTTQWLPRGDLTLLGEPLAGGWLNWSTHSMAAYASLRQSEPPTDPNDLFTPIPYFPDANGLVAMTRHEVTAPFNVGALKVSPYALGEAAFWGDGFTNDSIDRFYFRGGIRASLLMWKVYPYLQSDVFNLNGLAHKMVFNLDYGWAEATRDLSTIPQWNEFNDDAQERFEQRYVDNTFGGVLPPEFDPRFYAVRYGAGTWVTDPYHELVDDQQALRLGWNHRLQTKVGPPERQRIKDWMTLDLGVTVFPDADRDNFGETFGLLSSRYAWRVGDRTTILASSLTDFFDNAQNLWSVGVLSQRSQRGALYFGLRNIDGGPLDSQILTASYIYKMSDKWMSRMSTAYDLGENQNRGQSLTVTRIGEWLLLHIGANFDASKNNVGIAIAVEPRLGNTGTSTGNLNALLNGPPR